MAFTPEQYQEYQQQQDELKQRQRASGQRGAFSRRPRDTDLDDRVWMGGWKGRSRGVWTGALMGAVYGLAAGALIAVAFMGGAATLAGVGLAMAGLGSLGAISGIAIAADVGVTAGAVASGSKETIRAMKNEIHASETRVLRALGKEPEASIDPAYNLSTGGGASEPLQPNGWRKYLNFKVLAVSVLAGMAIGALFALAVPIGGAGVLAAATTTLGLGTSKAAAVGLSMAVFGAVGSSFGFNFPVISNSVQKFMGRVLSGEIFESHATHQPAIALQAAPPTQSPSTAQDLMPSNETNPQVTGKGFSTKLSPQAGQSFQQRVEFPLQVEAGLAPTR